MQELILGAQILVLVSVGGIVFWLIKIIGSLKQGIDSQKAIIDSFKEQSVYVGNLQTTVSKLYKPDEIENLVNIKLETALAEERKARGDQLTSFFDHLKPLQQFSYRSILYLSESAVEDIFKKIDQTPHSNELKADLLDFQRSIVKLRKEAIESLK